MFDSLFKDMTDKFWMNVRYAIIAGGVALIVWASRGWIDESQATEVMQPIAEIIIGFLMAAAAWVWGNYVRKDTKTIPEDVARREDIPTVNTATGEVQPPSAFT